MNKNAAIVSLVLIGAAGIALVYFAAQQPMPVEDVSQPAVNRQANQPMPPAAMNGNANVNANSNANQPNSQMPLPEGKFSVAASDVNYFEGVNGYLAKPTVKGKYPGVVMVHEWWGLNSNIKDMARNLASHGYVVLAVDLHNGKVAATPDEARQLTGALDQAKAVQNMRAAASYMKVKESATEIGGLGWCFGGGQSLQLALSGEKLGATVIYYGTLVTDKEKLKVINWPVLGIFGDKDTSIPLTTVNAFKSALDDLRIKNEIYIYPGVGHAFANPSGMNYAAKETADAWDKTRKFLDVNLD